MAKPTREDAHLLLEIASWSSASGVMEAVNWVRSEDFVPDFASFDSKYPEGSEGRLRLNKVLGHNETVATLWKNKLISEELLFDWLWVTGMWDLVKDVAVGMREKSGVSALWENFEAMAERQRALMSLPVKSTVKKTTPRARKTRSTTPARKR